MKGFAAKATRGLNLGSLVLASDNSGARIVRIVSVKGGKTRKGRQQYAKIGDWVKVSVRKGKMMSGRYPQNASKEIIILLKSLKANALAHNLELEKLRLFCMANVASRPYRRFGRRRFKRSHVQIKLVPITKQGK